jgi:integrase
LAPRGEGRAHAVKGRKVTLRYVVEEYVREQKARGRRTDKSAGEVSSSLDLVLDLLGGSTPAKAVSRPMMLRCLEDLQRLPSNMTKRFNGKNARDLLKAEHTDTLASRTVNKTMSRISAVFESAVRNGHLPSNPARGLHVQLRTKANEDREPYSPEDLGGLFAALQRFKTRAPERYWIPLLGLYSGMRLNEIAQLYTEDVREADGVLVFDVNDSSDKRLKNTASRRLVPIHSKLIGLGFLEHVEAMRQAAFPRVWPKLKKSRDGYGHGFGKWFQAFNRKHVTANPKKVFHSLRHVVGDALFRAGVGESIRAKILGHALRTVTTETYTGENHLGMLKEALERLSFPLE